MADLDTITSVIRQFGDHNPDIHDVMEPPDDSPAGRDIAAVADDPVRLERLANCRGLAGVRLGEAGRCLDACVVVVEAVDEPDTPVHALARVAMESSAWSMWLCDLTLSTEERISRVAADELHGRTETAKLVGEFGHVAIGAEALRSELAADGVTKARRPTSTMVVGQVLTDEPDLVAAMRFTYRNLSARLHMSSQVLISAPGHFGGSVSPMKHAAAVWLEAAFEFHQYIGWKDLTEWVAWGNEMKRLLAS